MFVRLTEAICLLAFCSTCAASDYGAPDTDLLAEADQWIYARGTWEINTKYRDENGEMKQAERTAEVENRYLADGITVQSNFRIGDDFFSVQIRAC